MIAEKIDENNIYAFKTNEKDETKNYADIFEFMEKYEDTYNSFRKYAGLGFEYHPEEGITCFKCKGDGKYINHEGREFYCRCFGFNIPKDSVICSSCQGTGEYDKMECQTCSSFGHHYYYEKEYQVQCSICKGTGKNKEKKCGCCMGNGILINERIDCNKCHATGRFHNNPCESCEGCGSLRHPGLYFYDGKICYKCEGTGIIKNDKCDYCEGKARVHADNHQFCVECNGSGILDNDTKCNFCNGNGCIESF